MARLSMSFEDCSKRSKYITTLINVIMNCQWNVDTITYSFENKKNRIRGGSNDDNQFGIITLEKRVLPIRFYFFYHCIYFLSVLSNLSDVALGYVQS